MRATDFKQSFTEGMSTEESFEARARRAGFSVRKATFNENVRDHIDFELIRQVGGEVLTVDVKGSKRINRGDSDRTNDLLWIEIMNVQGRYGWLLGKATHIVFQIGEGFFFIKRETLLERVKGLITKEKVTKASDALYNRYTRAGRRDVLTIIKVSDIEDDFEFVI